MSEKEQQSFYSERLKRAAHMLFFKRGKVPGARTWELRAGLGKGFAGILTQLDDMLKDLDLEIKKVEISDAASTQSLDADETHRYLVRLRGTLTPKEARMSGWRIDNLAALAACLGVIVSKQGKCERKELEALVAQKAGRWKSLTLMDTFLRTGYLEEDADGLLQLGWRAKAETDVQTLMMLLAESRPEAEPVEVDLEADESQATT